MIILCSHSCIEHYKQLGNLIHTRYLRDLLFKPFYFNRLERMALLSQIIIISWLWSLYIFKQIMCKSTLLR
jgi:hypothetical protein